MSEENSMDSISIAEDEDDIVKDNVAVTHEEESRWRSVADLKMEKMSLKRKVTSLRRGLFVAVRDRAITADAAAIDFELVQMAASEVIVVLEQLMEIFKARGEVKNLNSSITEVEELETRMSTLEVMVEELDFQAWSEQARSSGTGSGRGSPAIDMSTLSVTNASVAPATHSVLVASTSSSSGQREFGSSTGSVVPTIKFEPGTTLTSSSVQNAVSMSKPVSKPAGNMVRTPQTTSVAVTAASAPTVGCSGVPGNAVHMPQAPSVAATATTFAPRVTAQQHMTNSYSTLPGLPAPLTYQPQQQPMLTHQPRQQHYQQPYQPSYPGPPPPSVMSQQNSWNPGPTANTYTYGSPPPTARHTTGDVFSKMSRVTIPVFSGDKRTFEQWKATFMACVDPAPVSPTMKLLQLRQYLSGEALKSIERLGYAADSYMTAMQRLERKFGGTRRQVMAYLEEIDKFKPIRGERVRAQELERLADLLEVAVSNLKAAGKYAELGVGTLYTKIQQKLPEEMLTRFNRWVYENRETEGVEALLLWVNLEAEFHIAANETLEGLAPSRHATNRERQPGRGNSYYTEPENSYYTEPAKSALSSCLVCNGRHAIYQCEQFKDMPVEKRWAIAKASYLCYRCLARGHRGIDCPRTKKCGVNGCEQSHSYLLHQYSTPTTTEKATTTKAKEGGKPVAAAQPSLSTNVGVSGVCLSLRTLPVVLRSGSRSLRVNALLDDGSTQSYINTAVADELQLSGPTERVAINTLNGTVESFDSMPVDLLIESVDGQFINRFSAITTNRVTGNLKPYDWSVKADRYAHLSQIPFEQPADRHIDVLIGLDFADLHYSYQEVRGELGEPTARKTALGWTCVGPVDRSPPEAKFTNFSCSAELESLVRRMWEIAEPINPKRTLSSQDREILAKTQQSMQLVAGRYQVGMPWKQRPPEHNRSIQTALRRLRSTERRLQKEPHIAAEYSRVLQQHLEKGYVSVVQANKSAGWFLPHFAVTRPDAATTKVRVVFDASAKCGDRSLNDYLHAGPKLQRELPDILIRFRAKPIAMVADVAEMYLQIELAPEDRMYHRFLWRNLDDTQEPTMYEYNRVVFGVNSSPFVAQMVSQQHARQLQQDFPRGAEAILKSTYMDDTMDSTEDDDQAVKLYEELTELWHRAGMHARKWISNSTKLLQLVPQEDRAKQVDLKDGQLPTTKALGVLWKAETDAFTFQSKVPTDANITKRLFLKRLAALFDPLGFILPFVMTGRIIFQAMWIAGAEWDDTLPDDVKAKAMQWYEDFSKLSAITVPRCLRLPNPEIAVSSELHIFGDASQDAYGAVAYLRHSYQSGAVSCRLVGAKGKVAPIASMSIPRLELSAAVVGAHLGTSVADVLSIPVMDICFWTDSMNVLWWVRNRSRQFKPFIANRVSEIQERSQPSQWYHVPTLLNPADLLSRGSTATALVDNEQWWHGPSFLRQDRSLWPEQPCSLAQPEASEAKSGGLNSGAAEPSIKSFHTIVADSDWRLSPSRFASWKQLVRLLAWVQRYICNCRAPAAGRQSGGLIPEEIEDAEMALIRSAQRDEFSEYDLLKKNKPLPNASKLQNLQPRIDESGVMRVEGRTQNADFLAYEVKHPIILPRHSWVTRLIVRDQHIAAKHAAGVNHTWALLMQRYWVIAGREAVRECEQRCPLCSRRKARPAHQLMAPLPIIRLKSPHRAFGRVAVDYGGPFATIMGRGQRRSKRYLCLFTCLSCRAVHLEMAYSLDTNSFLNAFQRMCNRRGVPNEVLSDNGTNFVGGQRELQEIMNSQETLQERHQQVRWQFIPPGAPHFGGVHETMIKAAKKAIQAILGDADVTDEELQTAFCGAESLLNSRPLTIPSADIRDDLPITLFARHYPVSHKSPVIFFLTKFYHKQSILAQ